jgi:hypothetical protein
VRLPVADELELPLLGHFDQQRVLTVTRPMPGISVDDRGTFTLRTRIEYAGEVTGQTIRPWRLRQFVEKVPVTKRGLGSTSTWTPLPGWRTNGRNACLHSTG